MINPPGLEINAPAFEAFQRDLTLENTSQIVATLRSRGRVFLNVSGTSMLPSVRPGDILKVRRASIQNISLGDIVLFGRAERLYIHRAIRRTVARCQGAMEIHLITRGDSLARSDGPLGPVNLLGKVVRLERGGHGIDLETPWRAQWGRILAQISPFTCLGIPAVYWFKEKCSRSRSR